MDVGEYLAQFWGWLTIIMAINFFARPDILREVKSLMVESRPFALCYGLLSLILGLASVIMFNVWSLSWQGLVSLSGWLALAKGITVLAWPEIARMPALKVRVLSSRIALAIVAFLAVILIMASR